MNGNRDNYTIETEVDMVAHSSASIINLYPGFLENKLQVLKLSVARRNDKPVYLLRQRGYSGADFNLGKRRRTKPQHRTDGRQLPRPKLGTPQS